MTLWDVGLRVGMVIAYNVGSYKSDVVDALLSGGDEALLDLRGRRVKRFGVLITPPDAIGLKNGYAENARIPVIDAKPFLDALRRSHPFAAFPEAPLFYSTHRLYFPRIAALAAKWTEWKEKVKALVAKGLDPLRAGPEPAKPTTEDFETLRLSASTIRTNLQRLAKRVGIVKKVWTHLFRHSRATWLAPKMKDLPMKRRFTWGKNSKMPEKYAHLAGEDDDRALAEAHGIEIEEVVPDVEALNDPTRCPDGHMNPPGREFCFACNLPLDPKRMTAVEHRIGDAQVETLLKNPGLRAALTEALLREVAQRDGALTETGETTPGFEATVKVGEARRVLEEAKRAGEA